MLTDEVIISMVTGFVTIALSLIAAIVSIRNGDKADAQAVETEKIKKQTNGTLSALTDQLSTANATIDRMHSAIERMAPTGK